MPRRRDARATQPPETRELNEPDPRTREEATKNESNSDRKLIYIFTFFFIILPAVSIYVYSHNFGPNSTRPAKPHVHRHSRVAENLNYQFFLDENWRVLENETQRHYECPVLAYITPWNSKGYEMAKRFNSKFTHLSPVWYDMKSQGSNLVLEGRQNADKGWLSELRVKGNALVLPRVVLEVPPNELLRNKNQRKEAINLIVDECKEMEYDGIVLESWSRWVSYGILHDPNMRAKALKFVKQLGNALHSMSSARNEKQRLQLIYVIGPPNSEKLQFYDFGPNDLQMVSDSVDGFSLMTYDFSSPQNPGPNAPLNWIRFVLKLFLGSAGSDLRTHSHKIFLGINFYGNDFMISGGKGSGGGAIVGREYLSLIEEHKPALQWEKNSAEHFFLYADDKNVQHAVFYPSLMSISVRLGEAQTWGVGISIWEIGQGLDYFFDLL